MFPIQKHPKAGDIRLTNNAIKFINAESDPYDPAPTLGQHNEYVYKEILGYSDEEYQKLVNEKII